MALALDAKTQFAGDDTDVSSITWQHTCTGADLVLIVRVQQCDPDPVAISTVTYNSVAMTQIAASVSSRDFGTYAFRTEFWYLINPDTGGAFDIVVTPASECENLTGGASSWTGAKQDAGVIRGAAVANSATAGSTVSVAISSATGDFVIDAGAAGNNWNPTVGASQTLLHSGTSGVAGGTGFQIDHGSSYESGAASVTMSWTNGGANSVGWVTSAISIVPAVTTLSVAGTLTSAGAIVILAKVVRGGTLTTSGAILYKVSTAFAAALSLVGALVNTGILAFGGTLTAAGAGIWQANKALAGTLTTVGTLGTFILIVLGGTLTSAGSVVWRISTAFSGALTSAGSLAFTRLITISHTLLTTGYALRLRPTLALAGTLTTAGAVTVGLSLLRTFTGTLSSAGALVATRSLFFGGTLTTAGALVRVPQVILVGTLSSGGNLLKKAITAFAGTLTSAGALFQHEPEVVPFNASSIPTLALSASQVATLALAASSIPTGAFNASSIPTLALAASYDA